MKSYPMTPALARREYEFEYQGGVTTVVLVVGTPAPFLDAPHGDWYCPWTIQAPHKSWRHYAGGMDELQALLLAISAIRVELEQLAKTGKVSWLGSDDLGLDLTG